MALYAGDNQKRRIYLDGKFYKIHIADSSNENRTVLTLPDNEVSNDTNGYSLPMEEAVNKNG